MYFFMYMKVISFDVGIKNMAYCLFDISGNQKTIIDWKVVSLLGEEIPVHMCSYKQTTKDKQNKQTTKDKQDKQKQEDICGKQAKYTIDEQGNPIYLCLKHTKSTVQSTTYIIPESRFKNVKKLNMEGLAILAADLGLKELPKKKEHIVKTINDHLDKHCFRSVSNIKSKAGEADLISLGQSMKTVFQSLVRENPDLEVVLIENQISTLASRMKTVQGMLAQYFIMMYDTIKIEFISSANKLKMFYIKEKESKEKETKETRESKETKTQSQVYNKHKKDGLFYCEQVLNEGLFTGGEQWTTIDKKKKDDLADCFLQGVWWLQYGAHTK